MGSEVGESYTAAITYDDFHMGARALSWLLKAAAPLFGKDKRRWAEWAPSPESSEKACAPFSQYWYAQKKLCEEFQIGISMLDPPVDGSQNSLSSLDVLADG